MKIRFGFCLAMMPGRQFHHLPRDSGGPTRKGASRQNFGDLTLLMVGERKGNVCASGARRLQQGRDVIRRIGEVGIEADDVTTDALLESGADGVAAAAPSAPDSSRASVVTSSASMPTSPIRRITSLPCWSRCAADAHRGSAGERGSRRCRCGFRMMSPFAFSCRGQSARRVPPSFRGTALATTHL